MAANGMGPAYAVVVIVSAVDAHVIGGPIISGHFDQQEPLHPESPEDDVWATNLRLKWGRNVDLKALGPLLTVRSLGDEVTRLLRQSGILDDTDFTREGRV